MIQENLHIFVNDFGEKISFTLADGTVLDKDANGNSLFGIFDDSYCNSEVGYTAVISNNPNLTVVDVDIVQVSQHNKVLIENVAYDISDIKPDGTGLSILDLEKINE